MTTDLVISLAKGKPYPKSLLALDLYEICDEEHASCNDNCPVYRLNGRKAPNSANASDDNLDCDCFKNGKAMLDFIIKH